MKEKKHPDLIVDPEFASQIPPLHPDEYEKLENSILEDKAVINPIVVWNGIIVDGHHRYKIICDHPETDISYQIFEKEFPDRYAAQAWMCNNQLGRRNLTPEQKKYLIGKQYEAEKASCICERPRDDIGRFIPRGQIDLMGPDKTRKKIAEENHTSDSYVKRAEKYAQGVDRAEEIVPGTRQEILSGIIKPSDRAMSEFLKAKDLEEQRILIDGFHEEKRSLKPPKAEQSNIEDGYADEDEAPVTHVTVRQVEDTVAAMNASEGKASEDDVIFEMNDAMELLIFRWNKCVEMNPEAARGSSYRRRRDELIKKGVDFLHNFKHTGG